MNDGIQLPPDGDLDGAKGIGAFVGFLVFTLLAIVLCWFYLR